MIKPASPLPFNVGPSNHGKEHFVILDKTGECVASTSSGIHPKEVNEQNALYIKTACNLFPALVEGLQKISHGQQGPFSGDDTYEAWQKCRAIAKELLKQCEGAK